MIFFPTYTLHQGFGRGWYYTYFKHAIKATVNFLYATVTLSLEGTVDLKSPTNSGYYILSTMPSIIIFGK